jgi:DNA invertase Pin-like site-specific DNA recombinase
MGKAAGIYCRISKDVAGELLGVARQEADCRELAAARGWDVAELYIDNDLSAYSGKPRPEYLRLLADIEAGRIDALVCWDPDRLHRRPIELEHFIPLVEKHRVEIAMVMAGYYDLTTANGRMVARMLGVTARHESEHKSERTKRKHLELAEAGKPVGSTRPFGYEPDRVTIRPDEATLIREAAERVLAGQSLRSLCLEWNTAGMTAPRGGRWTPTAMRRILLSARIIGMRSLHGETVAPAVWPAIIDEPTQRRVAAVLADRATSWPRNRRQYLLTGLLRCGRCGVRLFGRPNIRREQRSRTYICPNDPAKGGCGGLRIVAEPLEAELLAQAEAVLDSPEYHAALEQHDQDGKPDELVTELMRVEDELEQWALDRADGTVTRAQFLAATKRLQDRTDEVQRELAQAEHDARKPAATSGLDLMKLDLEQQRAILTELIDHVTILPAKPGAGRFDPERADVTWRI